MTGQSCTSSIPTVPDSLQKAISDGTRKATVTYSTGLYIGTLTVSISEAA